MWELCGGKVESVRLSVCGGWRGEAVWPCVHARVYVCIMCVVVCLSVCVWVVCVRVYVSDALGVKHLVAQFGLTLTSTCLG